MRRSKRLIEGLTLRPVTLYDLEWVERTVTEHFGSPRVVSRGTLHRVRDLAGLVAVRGGQRVGLLQYHIDDRDFEVVILVALKPRLGIGSQLLEAARPIARAAHCRRMWLVTTNNNTEAIAFYRSIGWPQVAVHAGAVVQARLLKPEIPTIDAQGRAIEDELEFEYPLQ